MEKKREISTSLFFVAIFLFALQTRLGSRTEMINVEAKYFNFSRIFLLAVGLWPYRQSELTQLQRILIVGILTTAITFHVRRSIENRCYYITIYYTTTDSKLSYI